MSGERDAGSARRRRFVAAARAETDSRCVRCLREQRRPPPGERPAPLSEVAGPQAAVTVGYVAAGVPLLGAPLMASPSAEAIDESTFSFLLAGNVARVKEEAEKKELVVVLASKEQRLLVEMEGSCDPRNALLGSYLLPHGSRPRPRC